MNNPNHTLLNAPPLGLVAEQRIALEGIGYAIDAMELGYSQLLSLAEKAAAAQFGEIERQLRIAILEQAWLIVDRGHALIKLFEAVEDSITGPTLKQFQEKYVSATRLRNYMDHLHSQIGNLASSRKARPPLFGVLHFAVLKKVDHIGILEFQFVTINSGTFSKPEGEFRYGLPFKKKFERVIDHFQLWASDYRIDISDIVSDAIEIRNIFNTKVAEAAKQTIVSDAAKFEREAEQLLKPVGGPFEARVTVRRE